MACMLQAGPAVDIPHGAGLLACGGGSHRRWASAEAPAAAVLSPPVAGWLPPCLLLPKSAALLL